MDVDAHWMVALEAIASIRCAYISLKKGCSSRERSKMRGRVVSMVEGASADIAGCEVGESFQRIWPINVRLGEVFVCRRYLPTKAMSRPLVLRK